VQPRWAVHTQENGMLLDIILDALGFPRTGW